MNVMKMLPRLRSEKPSLDKITTETVREAG